MSKICIHLMKSVDVFFKTITHCTCRLRYFQCFLVHRVRTGHGKPGKSWNLIISFSRSGKSWNLDVGHGKSWKISMLSMSERQRDPKLKN